MKKKEADIFFLSCSRQMFYPDVKNPFKILEIPSEWQVVLRVQKTTFWLFQILLNAIFFRKSDAQPCGSTATCETVYKYAGY